MAIAQRYGISMGAGDDLTAPGRVRGPKGARMVDFPALVRPEARGAADEGGLGGHIGARFTQVEPCERRSLT